jgi:hypothetical protein
MFFSEKSSDRGAPHDFKDMIGKAGEADPDL